jgi:hypothetical protein
VPVAQHLIIATWEAEIRRIDIKIQPGQIVCETPSSKWAVGVAQAEFKLQSHPPPKKSTTLMPFQVKKN